MRKAGLKITGCAVFVLSAAVTAFGVEPRWTVGEPNVPGQLQAIKKQLLSRQIEALDESSQKSQTGGLKDRLGIMIEQIGLLQIPAADKKEPASPAGDVNKTDGQQRQKAPAGAKPDSAKEEKSQQPGRDVLISLDGIKDVGRPMLVADALYLKRDYNRAARFYEMALSRFKPEGQELERQWAMFQLGNCYRDIDSAKSSAYFERLISEYPSCWCADAANVQRSCGLWMKENQTKLSQSLEHSEPNSI